VVAYSPARLQHRLDAAHLYTLVLEKGSVGAQYYAVADEGVPIRQIAQIIGRHLNVPLVSKSRDQAADHLGMAPLTGIPESM